MQVTLLLPLVATILGLALYGYASGKLARIGEILFAVGLFWTLAVLSRTTLHFG